MAAIARYAAERGSRPEWSAQCDTCGDLGPRSTAGMAPALAAAGREGWYTAPDAAAHCPRHTLVASSSPLTGRPVAEGQQHADGTMVIRVVPDLR